MWTAFAVAVGRSFGSVTRLWPVQSSLVIGAIDSLAVLPFTNASADPNAEYLSDGITEGVIDDLSQLPTLRVMARVTVFRYKGKESTKSRKRSVAIQGSLRYCFSET